jgi:hypothetical protein
MIGAPFRRSASPYFFWRQKTSGFGRQNPDAGCVAGTRSRVFTLPCRGRVAARRDAGWVLGGAGSRSALCALSLQPAALRVADAPRRRSLRRRTAAEGRLPTFPLQGKVVCVVARNFKLRFRCGRFCSHEEASEYVWTSPRLLRRVESCAPPPPCFAGWSPSPASRGGGKTITSSASAWRCRSGSWPCLRRRAARCASSPAPAGS